jgi:hypothetical protein
MTQPPIDPDQPVAWRGVAQDTPVRTSDGETVGVVADLLGSDEEDIFHGVVVHLGRLGHHVFVPADQVDLMTATHVDVAPTSAEIHALPRYADAAEFEVGTVGHIHKHLGWKREKDR